MLLKTVSAAHRLVRFASSLLFSLLRYLCSTKNALFSSSMSTFFFLSLAVVIIIVIILLFFHFETFKRKHTPSNIIYQRREELYAFPTKGEPWTEQHLTETRYVERTLCGLCELQNEYNDKNRQMKEMKRKTSMKQKKNHTYTRIHEQNKSMALCTSFTIPIPNVYKT